MNLSDSQASLSASSPPSGLSPALEALWFEGKGDWNAAHECLQDGEDVSSSWVHAYLHRKEGDLSNAAYWYRRAGQPVATGPLEDEWKALAASLIDFER